MSDSIPVIFHVVAKEDLVTRFGDEIGKVLAISDKSPVTANVSSYETRYKSIQDQGKKLEAFSRGAMIVFAFKKLIEKSGMNQISFLADQSYTHEVVVNAEWGKEIVRFTVLSQHLDLITNNIISFINWCREHSDIVSKEFWGEYGKDISGREFYSIIDILDNITPSFKPNRDFCESDSWNAAIAFSVLKTFIDLCKHAHTMGYVVVCEHWGGFTSS